MFLYSLWKAQNWPVFIIFIGSLDDRQMGLTWGQHYQQEIWVMGSYVFKTCVLGLFNQGNWLIVRWCREPLNHWRWPDNDNLPVDFVWGKFPSSLWSHALHWACESLFFSCTVQSSWPVWTNLEVPFEVLYSAISQEIRGETFQRSSYPWKTLRAFWS